MSPPRGRLPFVAPLLGVLAAGSTLAGCGSVQLPRALSGAERRIVEAASVPAVVGVLPSSAPADSQLLQRILAGSGLFERLEAHRSSLGERHEPAVAQARRRAHL